jgi:hypothetical protein
MINSFLASNYEEVSYDVFYRDIFPVGSFEKKGVMEDGKYNGIAVSIASGDKKIKRSNTISCLSNRTDHAKSLEQALILHIIVQLRCSLCPYLPC